MPRPRPPHLHCEPSRHGQLRWYVRIGKGPRVRVTAPYGTDEFNEQYNAAIKGQPLPKRGMANSASLEWLIDRYRDSGAWLSLEPDTRKQRGAIFKHIIEKSGRVPFVQITQAVIQAGIDRRSYSAAKHFRQAMRGLFRWAVAAQHVKSDPTADAKLPRRPKTDGFKPWPEEWCAAYENRWPLGTKERVWYEVIHCTGLRRGDAVRVGKQHVKNGRGMIRAEKNDETAYFVVSDRLQAALDAGPTGDLTWIVGARGQPLKKTSFGNLFGDACRAANVPSAAHGIRKTRAIIEAENGASGPKLDALFGWKTGSTTSAIYIKMANRARLAFGSDETKANVYSRTSKSGAGLRRKNS